MSNTGRGILTIVSGFAGSGKGTVMKKLTAEHDNYALSVSATSRKPRPGEKEGISYFFKTREEFAGSHLSRLPHSHRLCHL